jgi:hypothetical protein
MIWNVIDKRTRHYRWAKINAIIEATWQDNGVLDADIAPPLRSVEEEVAYEALEGVSVQEAIAWANDQTCPVTLYLYDEGSGTTAKAASDLGRLRT